MMDLDRRFPCIDDMEKAARRRIPGFAFEYLSGGIGREAALARNRAALDAVCLRPRYLAATPAARPALAARLLGRRYDLPFGVAPLGLGGLMWPRAAEILAAAAARHNMPFGLSTFATASLEEIRAIAGECAWFQLYRPKDADIREDLIRRARASGFETLILTVDIPTSTRRDRELRSGLAVPPKPDLRTLFDMLRRPRWSAATLRAGPPAFKNIMPYVPPGRGFVKAAKFMLDLVEGQVSEAALTELRDHWPGKLVVKGIMGEEDALDCKRIGVDAVWVSNHGARQLDAVRAPVEVLPRIRAAVGDDYPLIADSGPRTGLDIARMLAAGADFVFLGRAFMYAVAAIGAAGADHAVAVLREELRCTLAQLGCADLKRLPGFLD